MGVLGLAILGTLVLGACLPAARDPVIDTWPVGPPLDCVEDLRCPELMRVGLAGLRQRDPGHAAVVGARLHREGTLVNPVTGDTILMIRSGGCCKVLVVELADGSTRAIGVGFPGISDKAIAVPWEEVPGS